MDLSAKIRRLATPGSTVDDARRAQIDTLRSRLEAFSGPKTSERQPLRAEWMRSALGGASEKADASEELYSRLVSRSEISRSEVSKSDVSRSDVSSIAGLIVTKEYLEPDFCHGAARVDQALEADPDVVAKLALDPSLRGLSIRDVLFLDTETTGLSGGTGTIPFLVGLAAFEEGVLRVEQIFLDDLTSEPEMLEMVRAAISRASCLVTYNGKAYDLPLLTSRFVLNRVAPPPQKPHLDLLHCARRMFRARLGGSRLVQIEMDVLGKHRDYDIDGREIPSIYWSYLRHRIRAAIAPVLEHNQNDVVALAAMLGQMAERCAKPRHQDDPRDHLSVAKVLSRAKDEAGALTFAETALEGGAEPKVAVEAALLAAKIRAARGEVELAVQTLLEAVIAAGREPSLSAEVHLALAKLYEHRLRDPERALRHARHTEATEGDEACARRCRRLEHRIAKAMKEHG